MTKAAELAKIGEAVTSGQIGGRRNIVINGGMQVAQRATQVTGLGASGGYQTVDRWTISVGATSAGRFTIDQISDGPDGIANSTKLTCTTADTSIAAGELLQFQTKLEGQDLQQMNKGVASAKEVTVSFYVKGNAAATYSVEMHDRDNTRFNSHEFSVTTDWVRIVRTFAADADDGSSPYDDDNAVSMSLNFNLHGGSTYTGGSHTDNAWHETVNQRLGDNATSFFDATSRTFFITGVQMEVGSVATPFENRSFGEELAMCKRYYHKMDAVNGATVSYAVGQAYTTDDAWFPVSLSPEMRTTPTLDHGTLSKIQLTDADLSGEAIGGLSIHTGSSNERNVALNAINITGDVLTAGDSSVLFAEDDVASYIAFIAEL